MEPHPLFASAHPLNATLGISQVDRHHHHYLANSINVRGLAGGKSVYIYIYALNEDMYNARGMMPSKWL